MALKRSEDPLVWIDCEMTGLDPTKDTILSIACFVTNAMLDPLEPYGYEAYIHHDEDTLANMNEWCVKTHTASGLIYQCISSTKTADDAATGLLAYLKTHVPGRGKALLAGNSVHADKSFLMHSPWNSILDWLHYRILDVSAIKEAARRWCTKDVLDGVPRKALNHTAREDILESIEEARYYQGLFSQLRNTAMIGDQTSRPSEENGRALPVKTDGYGNILQANLGAEGSGPGTKRNAAAADLKCSHGRSSMASGLGGVTQGHNGARMGEPAALRSGGSNFRTDVP